MSGTAGSEAQQRTPGVILVTGASRYLTSRVLARLAPTGARVLAVDAVAPRHPLHGAQFVRADIRTPLVGQLMRDEGVEAVLHLGVIQSERDVGGRVMQKDINVLGSMQLLGQCQAVPTLRTVVVKSSTVVYGGGPRDPARFTEEMTARTPPTRGFAKDSAEVESMARGLARRREDVDVTVLRMANVLGPGMRTPLREWLAQPVLPTPMGFDGRFQLLHEDDAVAAIMHALTRPATSPGVEDAARGLTVNVAGAGVVTGRQCARLARRPWLPVWSPLVGAAGGALRSAGIAAPPPDLLALLRFGRVVDTAFMRGPWGFAPQWTTRETLDAALAAGLPALGEEGA